TTLAATNIVWGTLCAGNDCENVVWGSTLRDLDNIVWGTALDAGNIVWGTCRDSDNIVWGTSDETEEPAALYDDPDTSPPNYDTLTFDSLFSSEPATGDGTTGGNAMTSLVGTATTLLGGEF